MKADVIISRCERSHGGYGMRVEEREDGTWWATWTYALDEKRAEREGFGQTIIRSTLNVDRPFRGCPHCEANSFVKCGVCERFSCWRGAPMWKCAWCATSGTPTGAITSFGTGGDR